MPEGLKENDKFPVPIITQPQADNVVNMMLIFQEKTFSNGIVSEEDYIVLEKYTRALFQREQKLLQAVA
jgi:phosphoribosylaminoimidazole-succinocarboxamide synthase